MSEEKKVSVLTLVRSRRDRLDRLIRSLEHQTVLPDEMVIAVMEPALLELETAGLFPIRQVLVPGEELPLSAARNAAAELASGDVLIFLDVDCLPESGLVGSYGSSLFGSPEKVFMGEVFYLSEIDWEEVDSTELLKTPRLLGERHPSKKPFPETGDEPENDYGELWGLSFALSKRTFEKVGGFDAAFYGYGGEETDFSRRLKKHDVPLRRLAGAKAFHQHHRVSIPPLGSFDAIIRNASLFKSKWGDWCMDYWLGQFARMELISWEAGCDAIKVLRHPSEGEIDAALQDGTVRYS